MLSGPNPTLTPPHLCLPVVQSFSENLVSTAGKKINTAAPTRDGLCSLPTHTQPCKTLPPHISFSSWEEGEHHLWSSSPWPCGDTSHPPASSLGKGVYTPTTAHSNFLYILKVNNKTYFKSTKHMLLAGSQHSWLALHSYEDCRLSPLTRGFCLCLNSSAYITSVGNQQLPPPYIQSTFWFWRLFWKLCIALPCAQRMLGIHQLQMDPLKLEEGMCRWQQKLSFSWRGNIALPGKRTVSAANPAAIKKWRATG